MCHPCSIVADAIAPKADKISNRAALPLVSFFCSTTRASVLAFAEPTLLRTGVFFPALSSRQLAAQVHDLPHMMIRMARTTHENLEAISSLRFALGSVLFSPVLRLLFSNRGPHHGDGAVKGPQRFFHRRWLVVCKLSAAVAHVVGFRDCRPHFLVSIVLPISDQSFNAIFLRLR